jgi:NTE family protein
MGNRKRVGLALGGGVVRGLAHVGVMAVLEEAGIPIDFVSGTSAGAIVASAIAAGYNARQLQEFAARLSWRRLARPIWPRRGLVSFEPLEGWLKGDFGDLDFRDLKLPCVIVATDMERGEPVWLCEGKVAPAVHASCCVPGFVAPKELNGRILGEGGLSNMLPVDVLHQMGADYVIGVDVFAFKVRRSLGALGYGLAGLEILLERSGGGLADADLLVTPRLEGMTYLRFSKRQEFYRLGRQATLDKLADIRRDLDLEVSEGSALEESIPAAPETAQAAWH